MIKSFKIALLFFVGLFTANVALAQIDYNDPKYAAYGHDVNSRKVNHENYIFFTESMKMKSYDDAEKRLAELLVSVPGATENMYIRGRSLYLHNIRVAETPEAKMDYLAKLIFLHDIRNTHFGHVKKRGSKEILKTKLLDYIQHNPESVDNIIKFADDAIKASNGNVEANMVAQFFNAISNAFMTDLLSPDIYLEQYEIVSNALTASTDVEAAARLKECESIFIQSGAADCTNIEKIYKPKYLATPEDEELMKKIMRYLVIGNCEGDFRIELSEKLFKVNPSAPTAFMLGVNFANANEIKKAISYFNSAIELETSNVEKAKYAIRAAITSLNDKDLKSAIRYSKLAITSDSENGLGYFVLAQAYGMASTTNPCEGAVSSKSVYWLIVDQLVKARTLLVDDKEQVEAIVIQESLYSSHFPSKEDLFFEPDVKQGSSYSVNCGLITGVTKVRTSN